MKRKIIILITFCIVTITALAAIQGYFIYNTYKLTEREVKEDINRYLLEIESSAAYDSLNETWMRKTGQFILDYKKENVPLNDYHEIIRKNSDSVSQVYTKMLLETEVFKKYQIGYSNYVTLLFTKDGGRNDTLFKGKMLLYGNNKNNYQETGFSQGRWQSRSSDLNKTEINSTVTEDKKEYDFEVITGRFYTITNWQKVILGRMTGLLIFSVLLFVFVVGLFYWSIKNLLLQKKIADIKSDFINNITHEFQTPLATMDMAIKTLQHKEAQLTPEHQKNTLNIIQRQNNRLQKLFSQVTNASLVTDSIISTEKEIFTCKDVEEIISDFKITKPEIDIKCITANDISITISRSHLQTALLNLMDNAVKYGAGKITVSFTTINNKAAIIIADNGPGISHKEQRLIFDKFYRIEKGNIHNTKGLGLGLYYVKQIAEAYKGSISVKSNNNEGSEFTLLLPTS